MSLWKSAESTLKEPRRRDELWIWTPLSTRKLSAGRLPANKVTQSLCVCTSGDFQGFECNLTVGR